MNPIQKLNFEMMNIVGHAQSMATACDCAAATVRVTNDLGPEGLERSGVSVEDLERGFRIIGLLERTMEKTRISASNLTKEFENGKP